MRERKVLEKLNAQCKECRTRVHDGKNSRKDVQENGSGGSSGNKSYKKTKGVVTDAFHPSVLLDRSDEACQT